MIIDHGVESAEIEETFASFTVSAATNACKRAFCDSERSAS
jgi:hypothetical protein